MSIHKKAGKWYIAYSDAMGNRHFVSSGIEHSPVGIDAADTKRKRQDNKRSAQLLGLEMERIAQGDQRSQVLRKRFAALINRTNEIQAEQSGVTLRTYFDGWVNGKLKEVGQSYGNQVQRCCQETYNAIGKRADAPIVQIDEEDVNDLVDFLTARKLSGQSINKRLHVLREMFGEAESQALVVINPVSDDHFLEETPNERQAFEVPQINLVLGVTKSIDWQTVTLFGYYCGMRLNDARSQEWEAIDFENRIITWVPQKTRRRRQKKAKIIKTPLHPVLYKHLLVVRAMCPDSAFVTPTLVKRPISNLSDDFVDFIRKAGIDPIEVPQPNKRKICLLTHHSLRHAFATDLKRTGAPDKEWTLLTGHSVRFSRWDGESISTVARIYNHVNVEDLRKWIEWLPDLTVSTV